MVSPLAAPALDPFDDPTGTSRAPVSTYLRGLHERHRDVRDGEVASYIPELSKVDPDLFGIVLVTVDGAVYEVGDSRHRFTIQSISKAFTFAAALEEAGPDIVRQHIGVEPTGDAFNSITLAPGTGTPHNPMVNAGAITAAGLVAQLHRDDGVERLLEYYGRFAGRKLDIDEAVYRSEAETGHRNRAIAHLLRGSGALPVELDAALDLYFQQCSVEVDAHDLGIMAATLANGGRNPLTGVHAAGRTTVRDVLTVMASCGMYDGAGEWLYTVGLPAKSGVGGGIIAVLPGQFGLAVFSPPLDAHGNSERGVRVCRDLSSEMDLHLVAAGHRAAPPIHSIYTLAQIGSKRQRTAADHDHLAQVGRKAIVVEIQGDLDFAAGEYLTRRLVSAPDPFLYAVLDLRRVDDTHPAVLPLIAELSSTFTDRGGAVLLSSVDDHEVFVDALCSAIASGGHPVPQQFSDLDVALEWCEVQLGASSTELTGEAIELADHEVLHGLGPDDLAVVTALLEDRTYAAGEAVSRREDEAVELILVMSGHLSVLLRLTDGHERRLATLEAGMLIGEAALASSGPRLVDVRADTDVSCLVLTAEGIAQLRVDHLELWAALLANLVRIVAQRADRTRQELVSLAG